MKIGILALQGAFREHAEILNRLGVDTAEVRLPADLAGCHGIVLPGGESTTQRKLAVTYGLWEVLARLGREGIPILATCAGLILVARRVDGQTGISLDLLDVDVLRNAYGRQVFSFETPLVIPALAQRCSAAGPFRAIFIRAPRIVRVGTRVSVLASHRGEAVAVREGNLLGLAFHPELTPDRRFHEYFVEMVRACQPAFSPQDPLPEDGSPLRGTGGDEGEGGQAVARSPW